MTDDPCTHPFEEMHAGMGDGTVGCGVCGDRVSAEEVLDAAHADAQARSLARVALPVVSTAALLASLTR